MNSIHSFVMLFFFSIFMLLSCSNPSLGGSASSSSSPTNANGQVTVSIGTQIGKAMPGKISTINFQVKTTNIADGTIGTINWYSSSSGTSPAKFHKASKP